MHWKHLGFRPRGRYLVHEHSEFFIDFVTPPAAVGNEIIQTFADASGTFAKVKLLTPTDCVKDRLAAYFHWDDREGLEQAVLVASNQTIDIAAIETWAEGERCSHKLPDFLDLLASATEVD